MTVLRLSRDYVCVQGAPVIHAIDTAIFSHRYFARCMACNFCDDQCCSYGVDIDLDNVARLKALGDDFAARIATPPEDWFTSEVVEDPEFAGGRHVRTQERGGKCVFRSEGARGCAIHGYAVEKGIDYHDIKPIVSTLFPVTFNHGILEASSEVLDKSLACVDDGPSVYEGARDELKYYFGDAFVMELDALNQICGESARVTRAVY